MTSAPLLVIALLTGCPNDHNCTPPRDRPNPPSAIVEVDVAQEQLDGLVDRLCEAHTDDPTCVQRRNSLDGPH